MHEVAEAGADGKCWGIVQKLLQNKKAAIGHE